MTPQEMFKLVPIQSVFPCPPTEPFLPDTANRPIELQNTPVVRRSPVVLVVAPQFPIESILLLLHRIMPMLLTPRRHLLQAALQALPHRSYMDRESPFPVSFADMRESKKVERLRLRPSRLF